MGKLEVAASTEALPSDRGGLPVTHYFSVSESPLAPNNFLGTIQGISFDCFVPSDQLQFLLSAKSNLWQKYHQCTKFVWQKSWEFVLSSHPSALELEAR